MREHRPEPTPIDRRSWIGAGIALGVLDMPKLAAGIQVRGQLRLPNMWPIDLAASYFFDNAAEFTPEELDLKANSVISLGFPAGGSRLVMSAMRASAGLCPYEHGLDPGELQLCAGAFAEILRVRSEGLLAADSQSRALVAAEAYARWHFPLSRDIGVSYSAGLFVPFMRDRFGYLDRFGNFATKFRVGAIGGRLDLVATYSF